MECDSTTGSAEGLAETNPLDGDGNARGGRELHPYLVENGVREGEKNAQRDGRWCIVHHTGPAQKCEMLAADTPRPETDD